MDEQNKNSTGTTALSPDAIHFIYEALAAGDTPRATNLLKKLYAPDLAELLNQSSHEQREKIIHIVAADFKPETLVDLEAAVREEVMELLGAEKSAEAISELDVDDAVYVIENLPESEKQEILEKIDDEEVREELEEGLSYPEHSAGRLMHNVVVSVPSDWTIGQTVDHLRSAGELPDDFHEIYVVDKEHRPVGGMTVSRVLRTHRNIPVKEIMRKDLRLIAPYMDQEEVAHLFRKYGLVSAPVADEGLKLVGVITADDIVDVIQEETAEDLLRMGGITGESDMFSSFKQTVRARFPWLFINLLTATTAASVVSLFTDTIVHLVTLAILMPIVASLGGNAGTQALTVIVRALAMKELNTSNSIRILRKEMVVALLNGMMIAAIGALASFIVFHDVKVSGVFALAIILNFLMAGTAGAMIPIIMERLKIDPAIASGICLTALTDMTGFFVFLGLASIFLM